MKLKIIEFVNSNYACCYSLQIKEQASKYINYITQNKIDLDKFYVKMLSEMSR